MLDESFDALKGFDWGADYEPLKAIDEAVIATHEDEAARQKLEARLAGLLASDVSHAAKDYVCRQLRVIGGAASVPVLASLLADPELSHKARYALERIPAAEAAAALRDALTKLDGPLKIGIIGSLGGRQDQESVAALAAQLGEPDPEVARAAAIALGSIGKEKAVAALADAKPKSAEAQLAVTDASLACAEQLLAHGKSGEALAIYKQFAGEDRPRHVRLAAMRGMLACAGQAQ